MAVAVKNPDTTSSGGLDRLVVGIFVGVAYILGSIVIISKVIPGLWWAQFAPGMSTFALFYAVQFAAIAGLAYVGSRLFGVNPPHGIKAGIALAFASLLVISLLVRAVGGWLEGMVYDSRTISEPVGIGLTLGLAVVLLVVAARSLLLGSVAQARLRAIEDQGWFSPVQYKSNQGVRVRRATLFALVAVVVYGGWSMVSGRSLEGANKDWNLEVPFTGTVAVSHWADATSAGLAPDGGADTVDRVQFRKISDALKGDFVRVDTAGTSGWEVGKVVSREVFGQKEKELKSQEGERPPTARPAEQPRGTVRHMGIPLLPDVRYTLPLIFGVLGLWLVWRAVHFPLFADFLIATEAEFNKVSWTTRKRLVQDTAVVLITVIFFTVFLFLVDLFWIRILSLPRIEVLKIPTKPAAKIEEQNQPW